METAVRTFRKRGRPTEDRVARRLEIFRAVAPELVRVGPRGLTMRRAAALAFQSVGALYYYFPDKRSLVMYGLDPEPAGLICREFLASRRDAFDDPVARTSAVMDLIIETLGLMRASASAVIEAGPDVVSEHVEAVVHRPIAEFEELLEAVGLGESRPGGTLEPVVRRFIASALFDPYPEPDELRQQLQALFTVHEPSRT